MKTKFFLAANSYKGFVSKFENLYNSEENKMAYIIKGGPGTGKSTLMKKVSKKGIELGEETELIYCSSDPSSLDAVIFPDKGVCIADGTPPHVMEPKYPGVCDTILNLCESFDNEKLFNRKEEIIEVVRENKEYHDKCKKYLNICGILMNNISNEIKKNINTDKLNSFCDRFIKKEYKSLGNSDNIKEKVRFISGFTPEGIIFFDETIDNMCEEDRVFVLNDKYGTASKMILERCRKLLLKEGISIITCLNPLSTSDIECIIVPEYRSAIMWKEKADYKERNYKKINVNRFIYKEKMREIKNRLKFEKKMYDNLLSEATENLRNAKKVHDRIESFYSDAVNYKKINRITNNLINEIF